MGKNRKQRESQFAAAWVDKDRQILVFLWEINGVYYVLHYSQDAQQRIDYHLKFVETPEEESSPEDRAWAYFEEIRSDLNGRRDQISKTFNEAFEAAHEHRIATSH